MNENIINFWYAVKLMAARDKLRVKKLNELRRIIKIISKLEKRLK